MWRGCKPCWQCRHASGTRSTTVWTRSSGTSGRRCPRCPGWPPRRRRLFVRRPRSRCRPARPSDEGGFDVVVEFCCRNASCRSKSAIRFLASVTCRSASFSCRSRSASSRRSRSFSRSNRSWASGLPCGPFLRNTQQTVRRSVQYVQPPEQLLEYFSRARSAGAALEHVERRQGLRATSRPARLMMPWRRRPSAMRRVNRGLTPIETTTMSRARSSKLGLNA